MAEPSSPLPADARIQAAGVTLQEIAGRDLVQLAGWPANFPAAAARLSELLACPLPADTRTAAASGATTLFMVGPERLWIAADATGGLVPRLRAGFAPEEAVVTELGHSRTVIRVAGAGAADLLARGIAIDLDQAAFPAGRFAQTGLHHTSVLLHRCDADAFDLYVPRSYARAMWDWLDRSAGIFASAGQKR